MSRFSYRIFALLALVPAASLAQTDPACSIAQPNHCQLYDGSPGRTASDRGLLMFAMDDFVPLGNTLTGLCVWGQFIDNDPNATQADCSADSAPDAFDVLIYAADGDLPDDLFSMARTSSTRTPVTMFRDSGGTAPVFRFELTLDTPINNLVADGRRYWISVTNRSESATRPQCHWHWSHLSEDAVTGNDYSVQRIWSSHIPRSHDLAFCMNFDVVPGVAGPVLHPCCRCDGSCSVTTLAQCEAQGGQWHVTAATCGDIACSAGPPANDACSDMIDLTNIVVADFSTRCATTDGPALVTTELGAATVGKDIWFSYFNDRSCYLSFGTCLSDFDTVVSVYHDPANPSRCPSVDDANFESLLVGANDEGCTFGTGAVGAGGYASDFLWPCLDEPGCYTIRVAGFEGASGTGELGCSCYFPDPPMPPRVNAEPLAPPKVRFLSMSLPPLGPCGEDIGYQYALRVRLVSLHHVSPPYSGGPTVPFTPFEDQVRWVGPPSQYTESMSSGVLYKAASLQCLPHYRNWSTEGLVHVTGSALVPSSTYTVETLSAICEGYEDSDWCFTAGDFVSYPIQFLTARWGDVEIPYNPPDPTTQPDLADVGSLVNKFRSAPGAPIKARALLAGDDAFGNISTNTLSLDFNFSHIAACVDAFRGKPYPYVIQSCP